LPNVNKSTGNDRERRAAQYLAAHGFPRARRSLAGRKLDEGDLENTGPVAWQIKRLKSGASRNLIGKWLQEAQGQAKNADAQYGFLLYVQEFRPVDQWSVYCYLPDLVELTSVLPPVVSHGDGVIVRVDFGDMVALLRAAGHGEPEVPVYGPAQA
jgi:hypothetical protein